MFSKTFCPDKRLYFLAGKSHLTLLRGWLRDTGYTICYDLPLFATICHYSRLFALFILFVLCAIRDYLLFAMRDYSLFAIQVFQTPSTTHVMYMYYSVESRTVNNSCPKNTFSKTVSQTLNLQSSLTKWDLCLLVVKHTLNHRVICWIHQQIVPRPPLPCSQYLAFCWQNQLCCSV